MAKNEQVHATVTRTFRAAIRVGEDFYTVEEAVTLPTATDDEVAQAVALGERIYQTQRIAAEQQIRQVREQTAGYALPIQIREPDAPASDKQRQYMDRLVNELGWEGDELHGFASERQLDLLTLTKRDASVLIDEMKTLLGRKDGAAKDAPQPLDGHNDGNGIVIRPVSFDERATPRQIKAVERLVDDRGVDLHMELATHYNGRPMHDLTLDEAGQLLTELQQRPRALRAREARRVA